MNTLYPPIEPYQTGFLKVDNDHSIYFEESGSRMGEPILFLHGGPGTGTKPHNRCFFDPKRYRIILFDQRGSGKSLPLGSLTNNTTWHLIEDIEKLRLHLNVERWALFGGSWGSTLALSYAIKHPSQVSRLILRGIFLCRGKDINWFYQFGAHQLFPDFWEEFIAPIPQSERGNLLHAFYSRFMGKETKEHRAVAKAWSMWGGRTFKLICDPTRFEESGYTSAKIECHYLFHQAFFDCDNWILENVASISHLPCTIVHGRYDILCPMQNAWDLHKALPKSELKIIPDAGHSSSEPGTLNALIKVLNEKDF